VISTKSEQLAAFHCGVLEQFGLRGDRLRSVRRQRFVHSLQERRPHAVVDELRAVVDEKTTQSVDDHEAAQPIQSGHAHRTDSSLDFNSAIINL
jgi:hypothetical protein